MKFIFTSILVLAISATYCQDLKSVNSTEFVQECMKTTGELPSKQLALWLPYNFWELVGEKMKISSEAMQTRINQMKDYMMFCVVDYSISTGHLVFKTDEEIRSTLKFTDSSRNAVSPLDEKDISPDAKEMIDNLRPKLAQMLGQFGDGMKIFVFNAKKINGQVVINVATKNNFTLSWATTNIKWKLPFASVLPPKYCPVDNEKMKGNWNFCPEHGSALKN